MPTRHRGTDITSEFATLLLLPRPMRIRESHFHPLEGSVHRLTNEPFGSFASGKPGSGPAGPRARRLARGSSVDVVLLPESAIDEEEIAPA
jgi:hypothetical protein